MDRGPSFRIWTASLMYWHTTSLQFPLSRLSRCNIYYRAVLQLDMKHCWFYSFFVRRLRFKHQLNNLCELHCTCIFRTCVFQYLRFQRPLQTHLHSAVVSQCLWSEVSGYRLIKRINYGLSRMYCLAYTRDESREQLTVLQRLSVAVFNL